MGLIRHFFGQHLEFFRVLWLWPCYLFLKKRSFSNPAYKEETLPKIKRFNYFPHVSENRI